MTISSCPSCQSSNGRQIAAFRDVPVLCNRLFACVEEAKSAVRGDIELVVCPDCGLIWNAAFDAALIAYASGYENALHHSPRFREFAEALVQDLVSRHALAGGTVIEIGCGDGYMLDQFVKQGATAAVGFDPSMEGRHTPYTELDGVEILTRTFDADALSRNVSLVLCRHVLEHMETPKSFISDIATALGTRPIPLYFEVPNARWMLTSPSPWDVIYEHVTYWTASSLGELFINAGLEPMSISTAYGDQFLSIEARPVNGSERRAPTGKQETLDLATRFCEGFSRELRRWQSTLDAAAGRSVIWGAGSKGITFANVMANRGHTVAAMVDLNPKKHGQFIPGTGIPVISPTDLARFDPELVLISNGLYRREVVQQVRAAGFDAQFEVISA